MNTENSTTETELHYSWVGYPRNLKKEDQSSKYLNLGGDSTFLHAEIVEFEDGSLALNVLSTGIDTKLDLTKFVGSLHTVVQQDYLESAKEERE